ncbi:transmembrane protein [Mycobacterium tuberculosis T92]|nr:transmembrane protein [Mycobacterium tuberculosis T92]
MDAEAFVGFRQVPAARYGGLMATTAALPRRIHAFVRWVVRTPWPLFSLSMLQSDIIGALFVLGFLRYGLPPQDNIQLQDLPPVNLLIFVSTVIILFLAGAVVNLKLLMPVFRWQRRDNLLTEPDPAATELARSRALRMPLYRTLISLAVWATGGGGVHPRQLVGGQACGPRRGRGSGDWMRMDWQAVATVNVAWLCSSRSFCVVFQY